MTVMIITLTTIGLIIYNYNVKHMFINYDEMDNDNILDNNVKNKIKIVTK